MTMIMTPEFANTIIGAENGISAKLAAILAQAYLTSEAARIVAEAKVERLRDALTGIKRAGKARMDSYGDEHSYYYYTALAALQETAP